MPRCWFIAFSLHPVNLAILLITFALASSSEDIFDGSVVTPRSCSGLNGHLNVNLACRCFEGVNANEKGVWIGCTRGKMPDIYKAFEALPNVTGMEKLWLWDNVMPLVPDVFFSNVAPEKLILETSSVGLLMPGALEKAGGRLQELELRNNIMTDVDSGVFRNMPSLERLSLSENRIRLLTADSLAQLHSLKYLFLNGNKLASLESGTFANLTQMKSLNLANNQLSRIEADAFKGLENLELLDLQGNRIEFIENGAFSRLRNLRELYLSDNKLQNFSLQNLPSLEKLFLSNNSFESLEELRISGVPHLRILHLDKNRLTNLPDFAFDTLPNLNSLSLANSRIVRFGSKTFSGLTNLQTLSLQQNEIEQLPSEAFGDLVSLERLFLSHNKLIRVGHSCLNRLKRVHTLNLAHNSIGTVELKSFGSLGSLQKLYLNDNNLTSLDTDVLTEILPTLTTLDLSGNPWSCVCSAEWFLDWLVSQTRILMHLEETRCHDEGPDVLEVYENTKEQCRDSVKRFEASRNSPTKVWITGLGVALGILSVLILTGIGLLFWQDASAVTAAGAPVRRVASDMVKLLPPQMVKA